MNKIRNLRHKSPLPEDDGMPPGEDHVRNASGGLFNRIKRYSNVSHKLMRRSTSSHQSGMRKHSPHRSSCGSYDMTGDSSRDLRPEIGAPVLITTTALDIDKISAIGERECSLPKSVIPSSSSDSDTDVFADASASIKDFGNIKFSFFENGTQLPQSPQSQQESHNAEQERSNSYVHNLSTSTDEGDYEVVPSPRCILQEVNKSLPMPKRHSDGDEESQNFPFRSWSMHKNKSKSATNLHSPAKEHNLIRHPVSSIDLPSLENHYNNDDDDDDDVSGYYNEPYDGGESDKENSNSKVVVGRNWNANVATSKQDQEFSDFKRSLSAIILHQVKAFDGDGGGGAVKSHNITVTSEILVDKSVQFHDRSLSRRNVDNDESQSGGEDEVKRRESLSSVSCLSYDFDMKSASFEDLQEEHRNNCFLSIEEFNALTREIKEINESEEFCGSIPAVLDQEYCDHRNNLQPNKRRVTLMRNKTNKIQLNLNDKREKITSVWSGFKHWIDEERGKFKEVVQRHSAMQRVGANLKSPSREREGEEGATRGARDRSQEPESVVVAEEEARGGGDDLDISKDCTDGDGTTGGNCGSGGGAVQRRDPRRSEERERDLATVFSTVLRQKSKSNGSAATKNGEAEGQNGFEELRRYVKQGGDFGKDLATILQERLEAELVYSKSLSKMASKLNKACREIPGSLAEAWRAAATEIESRSEVHRQFSKSLGEEIVKPLKEILDGQHKTRKTMENTVDKSARLLAEWRQTEAKSKKSSHAAARENEKLQDALLDVRISRSPSISLLSSRHGKSPDKNDGKAGEKDSKLDVKRRKAEESVKRADVEYYQLCVRAERARVDWEMDVLRSSVVLQTLETNRLSHMKNYITSYLKLSQDMCPLVNNAVERLAPTVANCNVQKDVTVIKNIRRASEGPSEQLLPDFYCEHTTLAMNRERRKQALIKLLHLVRQDLERERRSRNGLRGISQQLNNSSDSQSVTDKLYHIRSMLTYLEGTRYKLQSTLMELDHKQRGTHPLSPHIQVTRDRHGLQQSILKVPLWLKQNEGDETAVNGVGSNNNDDEYVNRFIEPATAAMDVRNEAVIGSYGRSQSHLEMTSPCEFTAQSLANVTTNGGNRTGLAGDKTIDDGCDRGIADGGSNQHDSDFDEFSSHDEADEEIDEPSVNKSLASAISNGEQKQVIGRCRAMYNYTPKLYDELELEPGDIIEIHTKEENGWWLGALNNRVGIFPATYVEELQT